MPSEVLARLPKGWEIIRDSMGYIVASQGARTLPSIKAYNGDDAAEFLLSVAAALSRPEAKEGMTFAFMAEVCDAAVQAMQANGLAPRTERLAQVRDQLRQMAALCTNNQEIAR